MARRAFLIRQGTREVLFYGKERGHRYLLRADRAGPVPCARRERGSSFPGGRSLSLESGLEIVVHTCASPERVREGRVRVTSQCQSPSI